MKKLLIILGVVALAILGSCSKENLSGGNGPVVENKHVLDTLYGKQHSEDTRAIPIFDEHSDPANKIYTNWRDGLYDDTIIKYCDLYIGKSLYYTVYVPFLYIIEYDRTTTTVKDYNAGYVKAKSEYRNIKGVRKFDRSADLNYDWFFGTVYGISQTVKYYDVNLNNPSIANDVPFTHPDIEGDWYIVEELDNEGDSESGEGGSGSDKTPAGDHTGDSRYLSYLGSTTGYYESGKNIKSEKLYVYCEQGLPSAIRVSTVEGNSYGFIIKTATKKVYTGSDPWGKGCNKYYIPYGIKTYFKWK